MTAQSGTPPTKLSALVALMRAGEWAKALAFAARFSRLGEHDLAIRRAHEAVVRPDFQRQLGRDPAVLVAAGVEALKARYAKALAG